MHSGPRTRWNASARLSTEFEAKPSVSTCWPCGETLSRLSRKLDDEGLLVIAVNAGESQEMVQRFLDTFEPAVAFSVAVHPSEKTLESWGVHGLPVTFVVNKTSNIIYSAWGARQLDSEHITERLRLLLAE